MRFVVVNWANQFQGKHTIIRSFTCFTFAYWWSKYFFFHINASERNIFILAVYDWYGIILQTCCHQSRPYRSTSLVPLAFEESLHLSGKRSEPRENARATRGGEEGKLSFPSPRLTLASPLAWGSRVTSHDSSKRRACSQVIVRLVKSSD